MTPAKTIKNLQKGFTLIELLVVIGILAILLAIVLIAINPARQFAQANNTQRASDVNAILNAIHEYAADNSGKLPLNMPAPGAAAVDIKFIAGGGPGDLCTDLVTKYIAAMPHDPTTGTYTSCAAYDTGYTVAQTANDQRITVSAPSTQIPPGTVVITVTR